MKSLFDANYNEIIKQISASSLSDKTKADKIESLNLYKTEIEDLILQVKSHDYNTESSQVVIEEIYTNVASQLKSVLDNLNTEKAVPVDVTNPLNRPPIFRAALRNNARLIRTLCGNGADVLVQDTVYLNNTPLLWAIANTSIQAACTLLDKSVITCADTMRKQINQTDTKKTTPLILAVSKGYTHVDQDGKSGKDANQGQIIDRLLELGADVNKQEDSGFSALHYACIHQNKKLIASLLKYGANPFLLNQKGEMPIDLLSKEQDQRANLLKSACSVFTLEIGNASNKKEIESLLKSKMSAMIDKNLRKPLLITNTKTQVSTPKKLLDELIQASSPSDGKSNATFLIRFFASPLTKSAFVLLALSAVFFGLIGSGFLVAPGAIVFSSALLLTSVGLFAGGGFRTGFQADNIAGCGPLA